MATIAYDVGKILMPKGKEEKLKRNFVKKIINSLEKNCLHVFGPDKTSSRFKKMSYKIPGEMSRYT